MDCSNYNCTSYIGGSCLFNPCVSLISFICNKIPAEIPASQASHTLHHVCLPPWLLSLPNDRPHSFAKVEPCAPFPLSQLACWFAWGWSWHVLAQAASAFCRLLTPGLPCLACVLGHCFPLRMYWGHVLSLILWALLLLWLLPFPLLLLLLWG